MSLSNGSTNLAGLTATTPLFTAVPFTVGLWVISAGVGSNFWGLWGSSSSEGWNLGANGTNYTFNARHSGTQALTVGADSVGKWAYLLARAYSASNRWLAVLQPDGAVVEAQDTVSKVPTSPVKQTMLGSNILTCTAPASIAELFTCASCPLGDSTTELNPALVRQIAYGGPFSVPILTKSITEYYSHVYWGWNTSNLANPLDPSNYIPSGRNPTWAPGAGGWVIGTPHPPLPYWYQRPTEKIVMPEIIM